MMRLIRAEKARRAQEAERQRIAHDAERIRARCQTLSGFVREAWHVLEPTTKLVWNWHLDAICHHLEAVTDGRITRLLANVPPGSSKSMLVSVMWQAWEWGPKGLASMRYLTTSFNDGPVKRDTRECRDLMLSEWYRALWPEVVLTRTGETSFANSKTGTREGVAFGSLTSQRGDRLVIDDPHSTETAESAADRLATTRKFREGAQNRLNDQEKSAIVVIMQRLHEEDVSGIIEQIGMDYVRLMLPMEFEPERACETEIGFKDPRTYDGELLDPMRFPADAVAKLKRDMGSYAYAGQYQQRPAPRSGGMFQRSDFEVVDAVPAGARRCRAWDFAASKEKPGKQPDWTVGLKMAHQGGIFYVEDVERGRWSPGEVETKLKNIATHDGLEVTIRTPQDPGSAGKADAATKTKLLAGYAVKVETVTGDKATRAKPASAQAEAGNVKLLRGRWNEIFLDEVCSFPNAQFDDQVDAFADALNELALGSTFTLDNV
ncbi:MAG: terminase [Mesorhizobium sp.]|nr:phage terminase large subunit [Mesorhizobium sp.]RWC00625.1 MAG: terminase [Mesorhizobium sp.]RWQ19901.1 MAG: terminase [Mesorhizobium sp.]